MAIMHDRIKMLRNQKGLTLSQIADALGTTEATAQRYETGKGIKSIPYEVIEKYANIFNCKPQYLMGWEDNINQSPIETAEKHVEMIMDEDLNEIYEEFRSLNDMQKKIVKDLIHSLAENKKTDA